MKTIIAFVVCATLLLSVASLAQVEVDARKVVDSYKDAVVTVTIVVNIKESYEGKTDSQEQKHTTTATVIDPSGLAVTSLAEVSPDSYMDDSDRSSGYSFSVETKDVRIKTADGTEIPADVVLRDKDLDLAFIRPKTKPEKPLASIDLTSASKPQVLDEVVVLTRLGQAANRSPAARLDRIESVLTKPRTLYILNNLHEELGIPAFTLDGKCVGVLVLRYAMSGSRGEDNDSYLAVVPCATLANAAVQAKEAKAEAKPPAKPEAKPETKPAAPAKPSAK